MAKGWGPRVSGVTVAALLLASGGIGLSEARRARSGPERLSTLAAFPAQAAGVSARATVNKPSFGPQQTLVISVDVDNPGFDVVVDFFLGALLPDGTTVVSLGLGVPPAFGSLADLGSLRPAARGVALGVPFRVQEPAVFQHVFGGSEPEGDYLLFLAATVAGALDDGRLGPGELLVLETQPFRFDPGGVRLPGDPAAPAVSAMFDLDILDGVPAGEIETDADGARWARTAFELGFTPDATVGQVNALLQSVDGRIVSMLEGVLLAVVQIPDPGSLTALDALLAQLRTDPIIRLATRAGFPEPTALPDNVTLSGLALVDHQLAVRASAAWNTRAALLGPGAAEPLVLVGDLFGGGPPGADFDVNPIHVDYGTAGTNRHGYHVLGIMAGTFGGPATAAGLVTGLLPATIRLRAIDLTSSGVFWPLLENRIIQLARLDGGNVVLNTSLGSNCDTPSLELLACNPLVAAANATVWLEKLRLGNLTVAGSGLEGRLLHLTAAGNLMFPGGTQDARLASPYASARLLSGLTTFLGTPVPNATNTLVIENRENGLLTPFTPGCLSATSYRGGDLSAIGTGVFSMAAAADAVALSDGTSMATPQAAALAVWVWTLRPTLTAQEVMNVLQRTASPPDPACAGPLFGAPVIDAYAAVLATDRGFADAPVRRALLDVAADAQGTEGEDQRFDEGDIARFLLGFDLAGGALDYSRFDLNGNAFTGLGPAAFDLDMDGLLGPVSLVTPAGTRTLAESTVEDLDILCYYAYSSLYQGSVEARDELLQTLCSCPSTSAPRPPAAAGTSETGRRGVTTRAEGSCFEPPTVIGTRAAARIDLVATTCGFSNCTPPNDDEDFEHFELVERLGPVSVSANEPARTVSASGSGKTAGASGQASAALTVSSGAGGTLVVTGTASATATATYQGPAGGSGSSRSDPDAGMAFTLAGPFTYLCEVSITTSGVGTEGTRVKCGNQTFTASGSESGVLLPGSYGVSGDADASASASASASFSFTLTLTPQ